MKKFNQIKCYGIQFIHKNLYSSLSDNNYITYKNLVKIINMVKISSVSYKYFLHLGKITSKTGNFTPSNYQLDVCFIMLLCAGSKFENLL